MVELVRTRTAMALAALAAAFTAVGSLISGVAILLPVSTRLGPATSQRDLLRTGEWLVAVGAVLAVVGCLVAGSRLARRAHWSGALQVAILGCAVLAMAVVRVSGAATNSATAWHGWITGVGYAIGGVLCLVAGEEARRARASGDPGYRRWTLWMLGAAGLIVLAVGTVMSAGATSSTRALAGSIVDCLGFALFAGAAIVALRRSPTASVAHNLLTTGLVLLALDRGLEVAVTAVILRGTPSTTAFKVSVASVSLLDGLGWLAVAVGAWAHTRGLSPGDAAPDLPVAEPEASAGADLPAVGA